jgi:hypothetical protein
VAGIHLPFVLITGIPLLLVQFGAFLNSSPCTFLAWTGYPCPFCGYTRTFRAMAHADWSFAWTNCPLGVPLYVLTLSIFLVNVLALFLRVRLRLGPRWRNARLQRRLAVIVLLLVAVNWIYRLCVGLQ